MFFYKIRKIMKHIVLLIVALLCMVGSNAQTRKPQMRKMGQTSQTVKGKPLLLVRTIEVQEIKSRWIQILCFGKDLLRMLQKNQNANDMK